MTHSVRRRLQVTRARELITAFLVESNMTPVEAVAEARRRSQPSRSDRELEKFHPERIEILDFAFESYKYGTEYLARKLEQEYAITHPWQQADEEAHRSASRRPEAQSECPKYDKDLLLNLCGCF